MFQRDGFSGVEDALYDIGGRHAILLKIGRKSMSITTLQDTAPSTSTMLKTALHRTSTCCTNSRMLKHICVQ